MNHKMKKLVVLFILFFFTNSFVQRENAYTTGEWFKMRIHYGLVTAGYATLEIKEATKNNKKVHHVVGKGWTTGMTKFFFKVDDIRNGMIEINMPVPTLENTYRSLRGIIKRKEYEVFIVVNSSGHKVKLYRRK
jgi:hypothetical protein